MAAVTSSAKNFGLSPAANDLGLGDQLSQQLQDMNDERKKKALNAGGIVPDLSGGSSTMSSPAVQALYKAGGGV